MKWLEGGVFPCVAMRASGLLEVLEEQIQQKQFSVLGMSGTNKMPVCGVRCAVRKVLDLMCV